MTSRYTVALHILGMLAWAERTGQGSLTSDILASSINTNPVVVRRLLTDLRRAGLVATRRGAGGGVALGKPATTISLRDVYEAIEAGETLFSPHPQGPNRLCPVGACITECLDVVFGEAERALKQSLGQMTIAQFEQTLEKRIAAHKAAGVTGIADCVNAEAHLPVGGPQAQA